MADIPCIGMKPILTIDGAYTQKIIQDSQDRDQYIGIAKPGSSLADAVWQIRKLTYSATDKITDVQWAGGTDRFIHVMNNYASLSYS